MEPTRREENANKFNDTDDWITQVTTATNEGHTDHAFMLYKVGLGQFCIGGVARTWRLEIEHRLARINLRVNHHSAMLNEYEYSSLLEAAYGPPPEDMEDGNIPLGLHHIAHIHRCFASAMQHQAKPRVAAKQARLALEKFAEDAGKTELHTHAEYAAHATYILAEAMLDLKHSLEEVSGVLKGAMPESHFATPRTQATGRHVMVCLLAADVYRRRGMRRHARAARRLAFRVIKAMTGEKPYYFPSPARVRLARAFPTLAYRLFSNRRVYWPQF